MKFECDNCGASYKIADEKVGERGVKVRCKKCEHVIIVRPAEEGAGTEETTVGQEPLGDDTQQDAPAAAGGDSVFGTDEGQRDPAWDEPTKVGGESPAGMMALAAQESSDQAGGDEDDVFGGSDESVDNVFGGADESAATDEATDGPGDDEEEDEGGFAGSVSPELAAEAERMAAEQRGSEPLGPPTSDDEEETSLDLPGPGDGEEATEQDGGVAAAEAAALAALGGLDDAPPPEPALSPFSEEEQQEEHSAGGDEGASLGSFDDEEDEGEGDVPDPMAASGDDDAAAPPAPEADLSMPEPPAPDASLSMPAVDEGFPAADAGDMPGSGMPDPDGGGAEGLDMVLEGAFSNMFGQLPDGDPNDPVPEPAPLADPFAAGGAPNPTALINMGDMDQLRQDAMPSDAGPGLGGEPEEDSDGWHVAIDDEDHGPMMLSEVKQHIQRGDVDPESLVWRSGMADWSAAREVPELASLFSQLPMPSLSQLDVGAPIDDVSPSPFGSQGGGGGADPFSQVPDAPGDPNWQPHGLTEVYAAANLAEAAGASVSIGTGGLGTGLAAEAPVEKPSSDGGGWSPGAASALQSLVNDELARIDDEPADSPLTPAEAGAGGLELPPGSGLLAEAGINLDENSPGLDAGAAGPSPFGASASMPYAPATQSSAAFPAASASMPYAPGTSASMPFAGPPGTGSMPFVGPPGTGSMAFAPSPPPQKRSPLFYAGIAGGGLLALLLVVSLVKIAFFGAGPDPTGPVVANADTKQPAEAQPANDDAPPAEGKKDPAVAANAEAPPAEKTPESPGDNAVEAADKPGEKDPPAGTQVASAAPVDKPDEEPRESNRSAAKRKTSKRKTKTKTKAETKKTKRTEKKTTDKKKSTRRTSSKADCDPVLDFDCDDGGGKKKKVKESLTKADILSVVKKKISRINSCGKKHNGSGKTVKVKWKVRKSGRTSDVKVVTASVSGTPLGRCLTKEVKRWRFPAFRSGAAKPITFPFKLK